MCDSCLGSDLSPLRVPDSRAWCRERQYDLLLRALRFEGRSERNDGPGVRTLTAEFGPLIRRERSRERQRSMKGTDLVDNAAIAELLAHKAEQASSQVRQAFRCAARKAFLWEHEPYDLLAAGKPLTELEGIGPFLARRIQEWFEKPPPFVSPPEIREEFLTLARAGGSLGSDRFCLFFCLSLLYSCKCRDPFCRRTQRLPAICVSHFSMSVFSRSFQNIGLSESAERRRGPSWRKDHGASGEIRSNRITKS
jgi:hypothetical protein